MNDPNKKPLEPQRTSQPTPDQPPNPMEAPATPNTEYEHQVPHEGNQPIARTAKGGGEGSYEGTRQYDDGLAAFTKTHSVDQSIREGKQIDTSDPELKNAEKIGKAKGTDQERRSSPSIA